MLTLKALLGLGGIGAVLSLGFVLNNSLESIEEKKDIPKITQYFLGDIKDANNQNFLEEEFKHNEDKNYVCKFKDIEINDCQIYQLNTDTKINQYFTSSSEIEEDKKIVISFKENQELNMDENIKIGIYKKNKKSLIFNINIGNLKLQAKKGFQSQIILAKVTELNDSINENGEPNFNCHLKSIDKNISCEIFKLPEQIELKNNVLPFGSNFPIENQVEVKEDIPIGSYVIIKTNNQNLYASDWKNPTKIYNSSSHEKENHFITIEYLASFTDKLPNVPESEYDFLFVNSEAIQPPQTSIQNVAIDKSNYKCIIPTSTTSFISDDTCEIYKSSDDNSNQKVIDTNKIEKTPDEQKISSAIDANKNFVLKIKSKKIAKFFSGEASKITIVNKNNPEIKYIYLNKKYKLNNINNKFKTNLILVKVKEQKPSVRAGNENTYKCKFTSDQISKQNCKVYSFSQAQTINTNSNITENQIEKLIDSKNTNAAKDRYLIIEINGSNNFFTEKELRSFIPEIYVKRSESEKNEILFLKTEYINSYIGALKFGDSQTSELYKVKKSEEDYLLVLHESTEANPASSEIVENNLKNYKCKAIIDNADFVDDTCTLKKISDPTNSKALQYNAVTSANDSDIQKSDFTSRKYFKLIINNPKILVNINTDHIITITSNKTTDRKNYGTVKVISKSFNNKKNAITPFYLVKRKNPTSQTIKNISNLKCKLDDERSDSKCTVYKFLPDQQTITNYTDINFSQLSDPVSSISDIQNNNYYVVKFTQGKHKIANIKSENPKLTLNDEDGEKLLDFELISPFYSTNVEPKKGNILLLK